MPVSMVFQAEVSECGLACAAMVANSSGNGVSLTDLRREYPVSLSGMSLRSLMIVLNDLGFSVRPMRVDITDMKALTTPCILHWDMDHYVVLSKISRSHVVIHDPAIGVRRLDYAEVNDLFTGVVLECLTSQRFTRSSAPQELRLSELWKPHAGFFSSSLAILLLVISGEALGLSAPALTQVAIDRVMPAGDIRSLVTLTAALVVLGITAATLQLWKNQRASKLSATVSFSIERGVVSHLLRLPTTFLERRSIGDVLGRLDSVAPITTFLSHDCSIMLVDGVVFCLCTMLLLAYHPSLFLIPAVGLVLTAIAKLIYLQSVKAMAASRLRADAREKSVSIESLRAHRALKLFGREFERLLLWQSSIAAGIQASVNMSNQAFTWAYILAVVGTLEGGTLLLMGGWQVALGSMTIGSFVAFSAYASMFSGRGAALLDHTQNFRMLRLHQNRISDIVKAPAELISRSPFDASIPISSLCLVDVSFRYSRFSTETLTNVSFVVPCGKLTLISGRSGGGKSTLIKILAGLLIPEKGQLLVNGAPLTSFGVEDFRRRVGVVMQDDTLLSGTLAENIAFFVSNIKLERVQELALVLGLHDEIMKMPMGYRSLVGDMGSVLSGGQKQRLLIARALYHDPDIILLDEGTANLDFGNEVNVLKQLQTLKKTVVMVSHGAVAHTFCEEHWEVANGQITNREQFN
jgi:ATP-binding cassette subfamily B protein RaxB